MLAKKIKLIYNHAVHHLQSFNIGDHVVIEHPIKKGWFTPAIVVEIGLNRDYMLKTPSSRLFRRNRQMVWRRVPVMPGERCLGPSERPSPSPEEIPAEPRYVEVASGSKEPR